MRAIVTAAEQPLGAAAVERLERIGAAVSALSLATADRAAQAEAIRRGIDSLEGLDLLIISGWSAEALRPGPFEELTDEAFAATWEGGMQGMLWALQPSIAALRESSGSVIVLIPTTGMTGGAHYSAAAATFEGQRILMKAAARQLAPAGIRVNAVAVGAELVLDDAEAADVHYLAPGSLGEQAPADVGDIVEFLAGPLGRNLSGQTITMDGGRWLAP